MSQPDGLTLETETNKCTCKSGFYLDTNNEC